MNRLDTIIFVILYTLCWLSFILKKVGSKCNPKLTYVITLTSGNFNLVRKILINY